MHTCTLVYTLMCLHAHLSVYVCARSLAETQACLEEGLKELQGLERSRQESVARGQQLLQQVQLFAMMQLCTAGRASALDRWNKGRAHLLGRALWALGVVGAPIIGAACINGSAEAWLRWGCWAPFLGNGTPNLTFDPSFPVLQRLFRGARCTRNPKGPGAITPAGHAAQTALPRLSS